jgi:hypothetical protein
MTTPCSCGGERTAEQAKWGLVCSACRKSLAEKNRHIPRPSPLDRPFTQPPPTPSARPPTSSPPVAPAPTPAVATDATAAEPPDGFESYEDELAADRARDELEFLALPPRRTTQAARAAPGKPWRASQPRKRAGGRPVAWAPLPPAPAATPYRLTVDVQVRTLSPNRLRTEHWKGRSNRVAAEHRAVKDAIDAELPSDGRGWIVTLTRVTATLCDSDRLAGSLTSVRDAIADLLTGGDDSHRAPIEWVYRQHKLVEREPHRIRARVARPAGDGFPARPARSARDTFRYRSFVRICIETAVEHVLSPLGARCDESTIAIECAIECTRKK